MFNEPRVFHFSRKKLFFYFMKPFLITIILIQLFFLLLVGRIIIDGLLIFTYLLLIAFSALTAFSMSILKTTITSEWLKGFNTFGYYRFLHWQAITKANKVNIMGLYYYRIFDKGHTFPIWLPAFHENQEELERLICQYTPQDNPLHRLIKKEQHQKQKKAQAKQAKLASPE